MTDYHARAPRSVRLPADTEARVIELAGARGESVSAFIVAAVLERIARVASSPGATVAWLRTLPADHVDAARAALRQWDEADSYGTAEARETAAARGEPDYLGCQDPTNRGAQTGS